MRKKTGKVLFVSNLANFSKFNFPFMRWFQEQGYIVDYASAGEEDLPEGYCGKIYKLPIARSPWEYKNFIACKELKIIINKEKYDIVHCHTPMGGVVARIAARSARKHGTKVLYTAHGFHFYKGAPKINWLLYYTMEKFLARYTDCIITINEEDYDTAMQKKLRAEAIEKIDGVGVNLARFSPVSEEMRISYRESLGIKKEFAILYIAEFITRKNHTFIIKALPKIKQLIPNIKLVFAGTGVLEEQCKKEVKDLSLEENVLFLGYRKDVPRLCNASDLLVSSSIQEGLPVGILEGMATGMPIVCAAIRGQTDVIEDGINGYLYRLNDEESFIKKVVELYENTALRHNMGAVNVERAKKYSVENAVKRMSDIYQRYM